MRRYISKLTLAVILFTGLAGGAPGEDAGRKTRVYPLNPAVAPCNDFYAYVCSKTVEGFEVPGNLSVYLFSAMDASDRLVEAYHDFLGELLTRDPLSDRELMLKNFYAACMDPISSAEDERRQVRHLLDQMRSITTREAFQEFVAARIDRGEASFLMLETLPNQSDPGLLDVVISSNMRTLPDRSYYYDSALMGDFLKLAAVFYDTLGFKDADARAKWLLEFETEFAETFPSVVELRKIELNRERIGREGLLERFPAFRLDGLLQRIPDSIVIRDLTPENFRFLDRVLREYDLPRLKSIYLFNALSAYLDDGYPAFRDAWLAFQREHLGGPPVRPDREQRCGGMAIAYFDAELDEILQPVLFPGFPREQVVDLVQQVRESARRLIRENAWLSPEGKHGALEKLDRMRMKLVGPEGQKEWDFSLPASYRPDRVVANDVLYWDKHYERLLQRLPLRKDWRRWEQGPLTVDASYTASENRFSLFQGILQPPFFEPGAPVCENLGGVGSMIGHELGHAIDDKGMHFDSDGGLNDWMSAGDMAEFSSRAARLLSYLEGNGHHGALQLAEYIGDMTGLQVAYQAALPLMSDSIATQQAFFIRYARNWCVAVRPGKRDLLERTDPHPLGADRVNEILRHHPGFQRAFGCASGDPMVLPEKDRVAIW